MNNKHLLAKSITLLYREHELSEPSSGSADLVKRIIGNIKLPEVSLGLDKDREILSNLIKTATKMAEDGSTLAKSKSELLQQLIVDCGEDASTLEAIKAGIEAELSENEAKSLCNSIARNLHRHIKEEEARTILYDAVSKLRFTNEVEDVSKYLQELVGNLEPYYNIGSEEDPALVARVSLDNMEEMIDVFSKVKEQGEGLGGFKFGFQRINKMFAGMLPAGKFLVIGALQHQHKTGFSMALFRQALMYNEPIPNPDKPGMKPTAVRFSTEDEIIDNMELLYRTIYFNVEGKPATTGDVSPAIMAAYVKEHLSKNGWHADFRRINPSNWSYQHLQQAIIELETQGHDVRLCMVDYLAMIPTTGCEQGPSGHSLRDMYRRVRNFMSARGITFITPHQLSSEAVKLLRQGVDDFVKHLPDRNFYADSSQISHEVDAELFIHIEKVNGTSWLTCQRGKFRRSGVVVPEADKYCALPFDPQGGLQDDINGRDLGRSAPGGGDPALGEDEIPVWM